MSEEKRKQSVSFLKRLDSVSNNGLCFKDVYVPHEIVTLILSHLDGKDLLNSSLVCKKWLNIARSNPLWYGKFKRRFTKRPKKLPWYVYYAYFNHGFCDTNLIKNGNGEEKYKYWNIIRNGGNKFKVELVPEGADRLPTGVEEFHGQTSCFVTSYRKCIKIQEIRLPPLCGYILDVHKPHIYVSEWMAGRFDCGCLYRLVCQLYGDNYKKFPTTSEELQCTPELYSQESTTKVEQWEGSQWSKVELMIKDYPEGVNKIVFVHGGADTQFWAGHYGAKMAGGVVKILFDTMEEELE